MELFGAKTFLFEISIWCETLHLSRKSLVIKIFLKCLNLFAKLHQIVDNNDNDFIQNCPNNYDYMVDLAESNPIFRL